MKGVEIDAVVGDSVKALELWERIFEIERVEVSSFERGLNEAVFTLYGVRFHLLDENPAYQLNAPKAGEGKPVWFNVTVPDIRAVWDKALAAGCSAVQEVTAVPGFGITNAVFADPFGYVWMLHEISGDAASFEERERIMADKMGKELRSVVMKSYLWFSGRCEEAFNHYVKAFGGEIVTLQRYGDLPADAGFAVTEEQKRFVLNSEVRLSTGARLLGCDSLDPLPGGEGAVSLSVELASESYARRAWEVLAEGGKVGMDLAPQFFAKLHGSVRDKFGFWWMFTVT